MKYINTNGGYIQLVEEKDGDVIQSQGFEKGSLNYTIANDNIKFYFSHDYAKRCLFSIDIPTTINGVEYGINEVNDALSALFEGFNEDDYLKGEDVTKAINDLANDIHSRGYLTEHQSLSNYYTKEETDDRTRAEIGKLVGMAPASLDTLEELAEAVQNNQSVIEAIDNAITSKADKDDVYTKDEVDAIKDEIDASQASSDASLEALEEKVENFSATTSNALTSASNALTDLSARMTNAESSIGGLNAVTIALNVSLNDRYTKSEVDSLLLGVDVTDQLEGLASKVYVDNSIDAITPIITELTEIIEGVAADTYSKEEIESKGYLTEHQSLADYYTKSEIENKNYLTEHQSLADYYTKEEINNKNYLTEHQSLADYYTKSEVENKCYLTEHQSLNDYYSKSEVDGLLLGVDVTDQLEGLATQNFVNEAIANIDFPQPDLSDYYSKEEIDAKNYITEHQSLTDYYTKNEVDNAIDSIEFPQADLSDYYTKNEVDSKGYLTEHQSLENYYSKNEVDNAIGNIEFPQPDLSDYYSKEEIDGKNYLTEHQSLADYYTKSEIDGKNYLTEHQSLADYYTKSEVDNKGYLTEHQSLDNYNTKEEDNSLFARKFTSVDDIQFVTELPEEPNPRVLYIFL